MATEPTPQDFEDLYPRYEFSVLVKVTLEVAAWIEKHIMKKELDLRCKEPDPVLSECPARLREL